MALLPLGNENLVAEYCQIERSGPKLAEIIAQGQVRRFDLGSANGRLFCLMASAGLDADVVHRVHRRRRGHINRLSYVVPMLQALQTYSYPTIEVEVLETGERLHGALVFVFNGPLYGLRVPIAPEARPDDGWLDLCIFERPGMLDLTRYLALLACRQRDRLPDFQHRRVRRVLLSAATPARFANRWRSGRRAARDGRSPAGDPHSADRELGEHYLPALLNLRVPLFHFGLPLSPCRLLHVR